MDQSRDAVKKRVERAQRGLRVQNDPLTEDQKHFCDQHYGLIYKFAGEYQAKHRDEDFEDLVSAGMHTIMRCARLFDESLGFKPSTYIVRALVANWNRDRVRSRRGRAGIKGTALVFSMNGDAEGYRPFAYEDHGAKEPIDILIEREEKAKQSAALEALNRKHPKEMAILSDRAKGMSLTEVGRTIGRSNTVVQRLERSVLNMTFAEAVRGGN